MRGTKNNKTNIYNLVAIGLMAALVFVGSSISIEIPVAVGGSPTRIHFGNIFCIFAGILIGPVGGGASAGIGSFFYDLTNPKYIASSPFTLAFKFTMAFVCGKIAHSKNREGKNAGVNLIAGVAGIFAYMVLYLSRNFITEYFLVGLELPVALLNLSTRGITSFVNGVIAVVIAVPLAKAITLALDASNLLEKIRR